jgi:hypothetical protein
LYVSAKALQHGLESKRDMVLLSQSTFFLRAFFATQGLTQIGEVLDQIFTFS